MAASKASAYSVPRAITVAPYSSRRLTLVGDDVVGTKTVAGTPTARAANALASPALPPEATTIPISRVELAALLGGQDAVERPARLEGPGVLQLLELQAAAVGSQSSPGSTSWIGVRRTWPRDAPSGVVDVSEIQHPSSSHRELSGQRQVSASGAGARRHQRSSDAAPQPSRGAGRRLQRLSSTASQIRLKPVAVAAGFEPAVDLRPQTLSRRSP